MSTCKTNEINTGEGWAAGYRSILPVYCKDTVVLTASSGEFEDGSGEKKYSNNADCYWLIEPEEAEVITINFDEFELEHGYDQLRIYDVTQGDPVQIATLWGFDKPEPITMQGNRMLIRFVTDNSVTFEGWKISYTTLEPYISVTFSRYKSVSINIFGFLQNKIVDSKFKKLFLETYLE